MAQLNAVKVIDVCKIAPQTQPDQELSLPLTFFDLLWLRFAPIQRVFFFELETSSNSDTLFFDSILPKLKASLSITLQHFLPLAGNITWPQNSPKPILNYAKGDAALLTIAETDADFHHLISSNDFVEAREYHPLVPQFSASHEKASAMALQITLFPNRGFSIGTSFHHSALDGKTSTMFVKSWAHICKHDSNSLPDQLKPFYDRRVVQDPAGLEPIYLNQFLNMDRPNNRSLMFAQFNPPPPGSIRGSFEFTSTKIEAIRQSVIAKMTEKNHQQAVLSTFSLTCAYTWVCLVKAEEIKTEKILLVFNVDCRSRLDPPIPAAYFGNCLAGRGAVADTKGLLGEDGLVVAVNAISEGIKGLDNGVLNGAENWISSLYSLQSDSERLFSTAGSHWFKIYDTDFGWGRPRKTDVVSIDKTGAISFSDSKNGGGGVEIGLVLKKHQLDVFASLFSQGLEDL